MTKQWGAAPSDWDHFDLVLGLGPGLLPVVSNLEATIDPKSKLKKIGKTPSVYNRSRNVVGINDWTSKRATDRDIQRWAKEPDYGICLQTRSVRALDVDIASVGQANRVRRFIENRVRLPARTRSDAGKFLLVFALDGEHPKRSFPVEGGVIEFLGNGQQFVAVGIHEDGCRYEWVGGLPYEIPTIEREEFEALWAALVDEFAIEKPTSSALTVRQRAERIDLPDPVADYLRERGRVLSVQRDGSLVVQCPWEAEHSTGDTGNGSTVWFPAGTNSYPKGHFRCLHAHCAGRGDPEFFAAVGYAEDVSGDFEPVAAPKDESLPLPPLVRTKAGDILPTVDNLVKLINRPDIVGMEIRYDRFRDAIVWSVPGRHEWQAFKDHHYIDLRVTLERRRVAGKVSKELIRDVVHNVAQHSHFDTAIEWLSSLVWDGTPRVAGFLHRYFGAPDSRYSEAVSTYLWSAMAGRVMQPGVKADMSPILIGEQGIKKSSGVAAMVPSEDHFVEVNFHEKDADLSRKMRGKLIGEIAELRGLHTKEMEAIKAFITRTHENWIPKFIEYDTQFPRRLVFIGTTNQDQFLADTTGNRRWLPVRVTRVDADAIARDRLQLWAEARDHFELFGVAWEGAESMAKDAHDEYMLDDAWLDPILRWLDAPEVLTGEIPSSREFLRIEDVMQGALRIDIKNASRMETTRIGAILRTIGYSRKKMRDGGRTVWAYVPHCSPSVPLI